MEEVIVMNSVNDSDQLSISFHNLWYSVTAPEKVEILKQLSGNFKSGRLCAIVGPSGSGKTSLLNILSGFKKPSGDGTLVINGRSVSQSYIRMNSSYIPQDLTLLGKLTVHETLEYAARLKLPPNVTKSTRLDMVAHIVQLLGLEKCLNNYVEKLSGGEKKRVSIGEELITNPPIMIFDEPTSGLDSVSTVQVVTHLKDLAHSGRTVICVIHQPSSYVLQLFDDVYLLSEGQCIYNGPVGDIVFTFEEAGFPCPQYYNRADFILEVASKQRNGNLDMLISKARERPTSVSENGLGQQGVSGNNNKGDLVPVSKNFSYPYPISQWTQFSILLGRAFLCNRREFIVTQLKVIVHLFSGILFGFAFYDIGNDGSRVLANISLLFILILLTFFGNSLPIILLYPSESNIFHREFLNNRYAFFPYFYSKIVADLPTLTICTFATLIPAYFISGQPIDIYRILLISLIFFLLSLNSLFYGFVVGSIFSVQMGIFILPATSMPMLIFCGFFIRYNELPWVMRPFTYVPFFRYLYEGSFQALYGFGREDLRCDKDYCYLNSIDKLLEEMDMVQNNYMWDVLAILIWILILKIVSYCALRIKLRRLLN